MGSKTGRNDPCPCGSGKKFKKCCIHEVTVINPTFVQGNDGFQTVLPGDAPSEEQIENATKKYQEKIKNSPMWAEMVEKYGEEKAGELLKECKVEIKK
jgi:hypothetical protein